MHGNTKLEVTICFHLVVRLSLHDTLSSLHLMSLQYNAVVW